MSEHPEVDHVFLYPDTKGEWRFDEIAANGETITESSEGYVDKDDARGAIMGTYGDDVTIVEAGDVTDKEQNG